jgi:hypothetical protein
MFRKPKKEPKTRFAPDNLKTLKGSDMIQMSRELLDAAVRSTEILKLKPGEMTPEKLKEAKVVLGYVNATNNVMKTRINILKMTGIQAKCKAIKSKSKSL